MNYKKLSKIADSKSLLEEYRKKRDNNNLSSYNLALLNIAEKALTMKDPKGYVDKYLSKIKGLSTRAARGSVLYELIGETYVDDSVVGLLNGAAKVYFANFKTPEISYDFEEEINYDEINADFVRAVNAVIVFLSDHNAPDIIISWFSRVRSMARNKIMRIDWGSRVIAPYKKLPNSRDHSWDDNDLSWVKVWPYEIIIGAQITVNPGGVVL